MENVMLGRLKFVRHSDIVALSKHFLQLWGHLDFLLIQYLVKDCWNLKLAIENKTSETYLSVSVKWQPVTQLH